MRKEHKNDGISTCKQPDSDKIFKYDKCFDGILI